MNDGSRGTPLVTAGVDLGDKYSYLCLLDTDTGKVVEEGRLRIPPLRPSGGASTPSSG